MKTEIHIWQTFFERLDDSIETQKTYLTKEECFKANSYYSKEHCIRFIQGRFWVKTILSTYTQQEKHEIIFQYNKYGKPLLLNNTLNLYFNVSHTQELIVIAVSRHLEVGIDIEFISPEKITFLLIPEILTPQELMSLNLLDLFQQQSFFYNLWVCKEASLKALGQGLRVPLNCVEIKRDETNHKLIYSMIKYQQIEKNYHLVDLKYMPQNYVGALAISEKPIDVKYYYW